MAQHNILGAEGEKRAAEYLLGKSYAILEKNWRFKKIELDIIAKLGELLVIVEVKTRERWQAEEAEKAVTRAKQRRMVTAAHAFMTERELSNEVRFDIIVVSGQPDFFEFRHIEGAFYPLA
jgi:putative endonuclease